MAKEPIGMKPAQEKAMAAIAETCATCDDFIRILKAGGFDTSEIEARSEQLRKTADGMLAAQRDIREGK